MGRLSIISLDELRCVCGHLAPITCAELDALATLRPLRPRSARAMFRLGLNGRWPPIERAIGTGGATRRRSSAVASGGEPQRLSLRPHQPSLPCVGR